MHQRPEGAVPVRAAIERQTIVRQGPPASPKQGSPARDRRR